MTTQQRGRSSLQGVYNAPRLYAALLMSTTALVAANVGSAWAGSYTASNETELRNAITSANADGDPSATITLTGNIAVSDPTAFPAFTKPVTINPGAFTLSGTDVASGSSNGGSLTFSGGSLTASGTTRGGNADQNFVQAARGTGGTGTALSNGSLTNVGSISGGIGGAGLVRAIGGAGGTGVNLTSSTLLNQGTITGGQGGLNNSSGSSGFGFTSAGGVGGTGLVMSGGSLNNQGQIAGGDGGDVLNISGGTDHFFGGSGGTGAQLSGGTHVNSATGTISGGDGGSDGHSFGSPGAGAGGQGLVLSGGAVFTNDGTITGGDGGREALTNRGGVGGDGAVVTDSTIANNGTITGGSSDGARVGGTGLSLTNSTATNSGDIIGGTGGAVGGQAAAGSLALDMTNSTITNTGAITGGTGGLSGAASAAGSVAITGRGGANVITSGTISGGLSGDGLTRANAINFTNGGNSLELRAGFQIDGLVSATAADTFILGGSSNSSFDVSQIGGAAQFRNFGIYQKTGSSTWTLTNTTTATTSWQILGGTLSVSSDDNLGAAAGTLTFDGGTLENTTGFSSARGVTINSGGGTFQTDDALTWSGVIGGTGSLTKTGTSTLTLTGVNTYSGGTVVNSGAISISSDANLGNAAGPLTFNGGILQNTTAFTSARAVTINPGGGTFQTDADLTLSSAIGGAGGLTKTGASTLTLTADNTYTGRTTISAGTLQIGNGGTSGSIVGPVTNNSILAFNRSDTFEVPGVISGSGAVQQNGTGTTVLTGENTYGGGTTITAGTLQLGNGGTTGSITGNVTNDGTLAFARSDAMTFAGVISGAGTIRQIGSGLTDLTGDSSGFTGTTSIEAGTLAVNGSLCGDVNVASGGRLQGAGTVCDTTNAGTVAPGNSIGTLTVDGDYAGTGGILEIETILSGTGSPADRLLITGNASGTTTITTVNLGGTGALTGTGNTEGVSIVQVGGTSSASTFQLAGGYAAAGPYQYHLNAFAPGASAASEADPLLGTTNFWDYRLQSLVDANGDPVPVPQIAAYQSIPSGALRYGASLLDSLHKRLGEIHHLTAYRAAGATGETTGEFFLRGQGSRSDIAGDQGPDYDQDIWFTQFGGNFLGWDIGGKGSSLRVGAAISVGGSNLDVKTSSAEVDLNATSFALTTTYQAAGGWYLDAVTQASRYTTAVTTAERGQVGSPDGWGWSASLESGYPIDLGDKLILEPQAQLAYQRVRFDTFTDVDNITVDLQDGDSLRGRLGGRVQKTFASETANERTLWSPYIELNALHEFLDGDGITASGVAFETDNGGTSVQVGGGLNAQLNPSFALFANISYEKGISDGTADTWGGTLGLRMNF